MLFCNSQDARKNRKRQPLLNMQKPYTGQLQTMAFEKVINHKKDS